MEHTSVSEQQIAEALQRVPPNRWREVLDFIGSLQSPAKGEVGTPPVSKAAPEKQWTAGELRKLPVEQRNAILAEQAALLENGKGDRVSFLRKLTRSLFPVHETAVFINL